MVLKYKSLLKLFQPDNLTPLPQSQVYPGTRRHDSKTGQVPDPDLPG